MKNIRTNIIKARWTVITLIYALALLLAMIFSTLDLANDTSIHNTAFIVFMAISTICLTIIFANKDEGSVVQFIFVVIGHGVAFVIAVILLIALLINAKLTIAELLSGALAKEFTYYNETVGVYTKSALLSIGFGFLVTIGSCVFATIWKRVREYC